MHPIWLSASSFLVYIREFADMMDFHSLFGTAGFAFLDEQAFDQLTPFAKPAC